MRVVYAILLAAWLGAVQPGILSLHGKYCSLSITGINDSVSMKCSNEYCLKSKFENGTKIRQCGCYSDEAKKRIFKTLWRRKVVDARRP
ncbi:hypothetical protein QR680_010789 [Steinernema hermaphroditum]|uniref:Secreted protein n=1 Tax=Steinernema hermaphroditum TaxID=289476 RepID=A0AA39IRM0_9BILA|nr:hypothetical protein QR680_010789 [Steinernema hermaphroditum]